MTTRITQIETSGLLRPASRLSVVLISVSMIAVATASVVSAEELQPPKSTTTAKITDEKGMMPSEYDAKNAQHSYSFGDGKGKGVQVRLYCRSGQFRGSDVSSGALVGVTGMKLDGNRVTGRLTVDKRTFQLEVTIEGGVVSGTYTDNSGGKGKVTGKLSYPIARDVSWFETARLGIGQHWGISSCGSGQISWSMRGANVGKERYEAQMKELKGQNLNPAAWAKLFKEAGAVYYIPYVKHHDGFCMWDTATHDYKITKTPCGRDVIGELYAASRKEGLKIGVRFSQADWHIMPLDMWPGGGGLHARVHGMDLDKLAEHFGKDGAEAAELKVSNKVITKTQIERVRVYEKVWAEYRPIMMKQYEELLTKYGQVDLIGGDGGYPVSVDEQLEMARKFRQWSPDILFGARVFFNCPVANDSLVYEWPGERPKPGERVLLPGAIVPEVWQSYTHWGNGPRRGDISKPVLDLVAEPDVESKGPEAVGLLVRCAALGWNLLYDIGPHDTGDLAAGNVAHLRGLAKYMKLNSDSIRGTWGGPYQPCWLTTRKGPPKGVERGFLWGTTRKGDTIYLHVTDWNGSESVELPPLPGRKVLASTLLATGEKVACEQSDKGLRVTVPSGKRQWVDTVIVLKLDGSTIELPIIAVPAVEEAK